MVVNTNLKGTFFCSRFALEHMTKQGSGVIINVSSKNGERATAGMSAYNSSKAGILHLSRTLAIEYLPYGIRVFGIVLGGVDTPMGREGGQALATVMYGPEGAPSDWGDVDLSSVTIFGGAIGVGIGFGLQTIASNFISGLILLAERPIKIGDRVEVGTASGSVMRIGGRSTWVRGNNNQVIIVPNSEFVTGRVINWTAIEPRARYGSMTRKYDPALAAAVTTRPTASARANLAPPTLVCETGPDPAAGGPGATVARASPGDGGAAAVAGLAGMADAHAPRGHTGERAHTADPGRIGTGPLRTGQS